MLLITWVQANCDVLLKGQWSMQARIESDAMTEGEDYKALQAELDSLASVTVGGFNPSKLARMQAQSVMLLYKSNNRLAESSERLAKRNLWLAGAVLFVGLIQVVMIGFQIWLSLQSLSTI
jgi:hypothetical protein